MDVLHTNLAILGRPSLSQSLGYTFRELVMVKNPEFALEISTLSDIVTDM